MEGIPINLGSIELIPLGQGHCFKLGVNEIAVFRGRDGNLFAIENRCPHRGGPLAEGVIGGEKVVCPLHGHKFDLTTGQGNEAQESVKTYKIWQENGNMVLALPFSKAVIEKGASALH